MRVLGSPAPEVGQTHFPGYSPSQLQLNTLQLVQQTLGKGSELERRGQADQGHHTREQLWGDPGVSLLASRSLEQALEGAVTQTCWQAMGGVAGHCQRPDRCLGGICSQWPGACGALNWQEPLQCVP